MKGLLLGAALACAPMAAVALSCMPHSVEATFAQAQAAKERFVIVQGRLDFDQKQISKYRNKHDPNPRDLAIDAQFTGRSLSGNGFSTPFVKPVSLVLECYGPWCASAKAGAEVLAFVELGAGGNVISTNPCGGHLFTEPTQKMIRAVKRCFAGGACKPIR